MNYFFAFFDVGGGVCINALTTSSNLAGSGGSFAAVRFGLVFRFADTDSLSAPTGQLPMFIYECVKLPEQPVPSNAPLVCEALSLRLFNQNLHAFSVRHAAIVPAEFKLRRVAVEMFAGDVMEGTNHAALEEREETFRRVGASERAVRILAGILKRGMVYEVVTGEQLARSLICCRLVSVHNRSLVHASNHRGLERAPSNIGNNLSANPALTLHQSNHGRLAHIHSFALAFASDERLVNFNGAAIAAEKFRERADIHRVTNAMRHKPRGLITNTKHPVKLVRAHALFGRRKEEQGHQPFANRNVGILDNGSNSHGELLAARPALVESFACFAACLGREFVDRLFLLAVRANRAIGPEYRFKQFPRGALIRILLRESCQIQFLAAQCSRFCFHVDLRLTVSKVCRQQESVNQNEKENGKAQTAKGRSQNRVGCREGFRRRLHQNPCRNEAFRPYRIGVGEGGSSSRRRPLANVTIPDRTVGPYRQKCGFVKRIIPQFTPFRLTGTARPVFVAFIGFGSESRVVSFICVPVVTGSRDYRSETVPANHALQWKKTILASKNVIRDVLGQLIERTIMNPRIALVALSSFLGALFVSGAVVTNCNDAELRAAIAQGGTVTFLCSGTISISSPTILITNGVTLDGTGASVALDGGAGRRLFDVAPGARFELRGLSLINGFAVGANSAGYPAPGGLAGGGAVQLSNAVLVANSCLFSNNTCQGGTGARRAGSGSFVDASYGGDGNGGAVYAVGGSLFLTNCTFVENYTWGGDGGLGTVIGIPVLAPGGHFGGSYQSRRQLGFHL
jgi:hypothetical protein